MKKLTIEEKAKAYDEAKARMSKAYNDNRCTIGFMNEIFPELESNDDRIIKVLIKYFTSNISNPDYEIYGVPFRDVLVYLENPKTQKVYLRFKVGDIVRASKSKGAILKIVGITDYCYNCITCATNDEYSFSFDIQDEFELVEDKQYWSEEDEEMIDSIIGNIKYLYSIGSCDNATVDMKVNWLKSLTDRYTYKPNEAQLVVLDDVIKNAHLSNANKIILIKLCNDLKKLRRNSY